jgi:sporulation protein YlmC with PRC-barrel domain
VNPGPGGTARPAAGRVYDAYLNLLDRQVIDPDGAMVCKVDDLELEVRDDGGTAVTAILTGPAALGPRLGGPLGRVMVAVQRRLPLSGAPGPGRISFGLVTEIGSAVIVASRPTALPVRGLEDWVRGHLIDALPGAGDTGGPVEPPAAPAPPVQRRLSELLGRDVHDRDGVRVGTVVDVRLIQDGAPDGVGQARLRVAGLVVTPRHAGRLLGYDRAPSVGPWLVRTLVRWYNHAALYVPWEWADPAGDAQIVLDRPRADLPRLADLAEPAPPP